MSSSLDFLLLLLLTFKAIFIIAYFLLKSPPSKIFLINPPNYFSMTASFDFMSVNCFSLKFSLKCHIISVNSSIQLSESIFLTKFFVSE